MTLSDLNDWMDAHMGGPYLWFVKRLSGNDTLATNSPYAGPILPKEFLFNLFPSLRRPAIENPSVDFDLQIDSHADYRRVTAIWYNRNFRDRNRNEVRITNLGDPSSALLDPENTGALTIFVFVLDEQENATECHVWVCEDVLAEDQVEALLGVIEPGRHQIHRFD